ncbi:MAG: YigZ family protein [Bacteroidetes bacterium]|nr:YigZ family protein [Bacteroidota bacterium]
MCESKEKGSKFIGLSAICAKEEEVKAILESWHTLYPQATHICYAYRLGVSGDKYRANDDGEPSNSAGAPILGQIDSVGATNVLVGVVRYYGGTKLGVGGLISAYKQAAKEVLEISGLTEVVLTQKIELTFDYDEMPIIMDVLKRNRFNIISTEMNESCRLVLSLDVEEEINWEEMLGMFKSIEINKLGLS